MATDRGAIGATVGGALVGATALAALGVVLGGMYVERYMPNAELEGIIPPFFGALAGIELGGVLGTILALRLARRPAVAGTALLVTVLIPPLLVAFGAAGIAVSVEPPVPFAIGVAVAAVLARWLIQRRLEPTEHPEG